MIFVVPTVGMTVGANDSRHFQELRGNRAQSNEFFPLAGKKPPPASRSCDRLFLTRRCLDYA